MTVAGEPSALEDVPRAVEAASAAGTPVTVTVPSPLLADGFVFVDTPGAPGFGGAAVAATLSALPLTDAVVLVSNATRPMTASEVELAAAVHRAGRPVLVVAPRADLTVDWATVDAANRAALDEVGAAIPVRACSAVLRRLALELVDDELDAESGFDLVVGWLDDVLESLGAHRQAHLMTMVGAVVTSIRDRLTAERRALEDGASTPDELRILEDRARTIQSRAARWTQELNDLLSDLRSAVDVDLRTRGARVLATAEARIDEGDPAMAWDAFAGWLTDQLAAAMTEHLSWRHRRLEGAVEASATTFGELVVLTAPSSDGVSERPGAAAVAAAEFRRVSLGTSLYAVLRNSYGGLAMFGFFGGVAGVVLSAPVTLGIGLVLGGKNLREERARQLTQRRAQAKAAARAHVEAAWNQFANDAKAQLRQLQRQVRDESAASVERLRQDTRQAYEAARLATDAGQAERQERAARVDQLLADLDAVAGRFGVLTSGLGPT